MHFIQLSRFSFLFRKLQFSHSCLFFVCLSLLTVLWQAAVVLHTSLWFTLMVCECTEGFVPHQWNWMGINTHWWQCSESKLFSTLDQCRKQSWEWDKPTEGQVLQHGQHPAITAAGAMFEFSFRLTQIQLSYILSVLSRLVKWVWRAICWKFASCCDRKWTQWEWDTRLKLRSGQLKSKLKLWL